MQMQQRRAVAAAAGPSSRCQPTVQRGRRARSITMQATGAQEPMGILKSYRAAEVASASQQHVNGQNSSAGPLPDVSGPRTAVVKRQTKETSVEVRLRIDGTGQCVTNTPVGFLNHMLDQIASHGLFDVYVAAQGDTWIDDHHTVEDIALAFGSALSQALGDRKVRVRKPQLAHRNPGRMDVDAPSHLLQWHPGAT